MILAEAIPWPVVVLTLAVMGLIGWWLWLLLR